MSDVCDIASDVEAMQREDALQAQQRRAGLMGKTAGDSATHCRVCDERIPTARRRAVPGVQTCIGCQEDRERTT